MPMAIDRVRRLALAGLLMLAALFALSAPTPALAHGIHLHPAAGPATYAAADRADAAAEPGFAAQRLEAPDGAQRQEAPAVAATACCGVTHCAAATLMADGPAVPVLPVRGASGPDTSRMPGGIGHLPGLRPPLASA